MFCGTCGSENEQHSLFCENCGNKILSIEVSDNYNEVIDQLEYEGYNIINEEADIQHKDISKATSNNVNRVKQQVKNEPVKVTNTPKGKHTANQNQTQLNFNNKSNNREYRNSMGQVIVDKNKTKKNTIPLVISIVVLVILVLGGIGALLYYFFVM